MDVALIGGSFNPPHVGHLLAACYVKATSSAQEVWLMPTFHHPLGKTSEDFNHRVAMCLAMAEDCTPWLKVSRAEEAVGKEGWTVDTLAHLKAEFTEHRFRWVIGSDILAELPRWKDFDRIRQMVDLTVLYRAGYPSHEAEGPPLVEISSSSLRDRLRQGELPKGFIPQRVMRYILRHSLYGAQADA